jgi:Ca2+-binding RTX toxin-like protein
MYAYLATGERLLPDATDVPVTNTTPLTPNIALGPVVTSELELSNAHAPVVAGTPGNDTIDAGHGGNILVGGAGADNFVFANVQVSVATPPPLTHVTDYSFAQGDSFDFSALTSAFHGSGFSDALIVRAVEDASGTFATLQVNANGPWSKLPSWVNVAQLDGAHAGDDVSVLIDNHSVHLAQIHVGLLV